MDSKTVEKTLLLDPVTRKVFTGVFASDLLPKHLSYLPAALVCNTDPSDEPGEHWVAIYVDGNGHGEYFDSYGLPPLQNSIIKFLNECAVNWTYNSKRLQGLFSSVCGYYCIYYLLYRCRGYSLNSIVNDFDVDYLYNDLSVKMFVRQSLQTL